VTDITHSRRSEDGWLFTSVIAFYLRELAFEGLIQQDGYGNYSLTQDGEEEQVSRARSISPTGAFWTFSKRTKTPATGWTICAPRSIGRSRLRTW
jgi:hypothetical protein